MYQCSTKHTAFPEDRADKLYSSFPMKHGIANFMFIYQGSLQMVYCPVAASSVKMPWFLNPMPSFFCLSGRWAMAHLMLSIANTPGASSRAQFACKRSKCTQAQHLAFQICCPSRSKTGRSEKAVLKKVSGFIGKQSLLSLGSVRRCLPNLSAWFWAPSTAALCCTCYISVTP